MSNSTMLNFTKPISSPCPANGGRTVGDGAHISDSVLAVCHMQGADDLYYYSTTFSGGPGVSRRPLRSFSCLGADIPSRSGVFDVPTSKCPPDRGSSDWVTDSPALRPLSISTASPYSSGRSSPYSISSVDIPSFSKGIVFSPTPPSDDDTSANSSFANVPSAIAKAAQPQAIPSKSNYTHELATPPLTPDDGVEGEGSIAAFSAKQHGDALDFLTTLFPRSGLGALAHAKSVSISAPNLGADFEGVVLDLPGKTKTLYVDGKSAESVNLRESIVALLDLADERLECGALVIALERESAALGELLHSLMYVGGAVVTKPPFEVDAAYVLVGLEI